MNSKGGEMKDFLLMMVVAGLLLAAGRGQAQQLPADAARIVGDLEARSERIRRRAEAEIEPLRRQAIRKLEKLQDRYTRAARLDEALAIRDKIRQLRGVRPDPGYLRVDPAEVGKHYLFEVTGATSGSVWGTEVYTSDSHLGTAAVHAGVLKPGQKGVVKVRILPGQRSYQASTANGITSNAYGSWQVSFTVEPYRGQ